MADPARRLDRALVAAVTPLLGPHGFSASRGRWTRTAGPADLPVLQWLAREKGRFDNPVAASVTLSLGAAPGVPARVRDPAGVAQAGRTFVERPLAMLAGRPATGYGLRADEDEAAVARLIAADIEAHALPWYAATQSLEGLAAWLQAEDSARGDRQNGYLLGRLFAEAGRLGEAKSHFQTADGVRSIIAATAAAFGIRLDI